MKMRMLSINVKPCQWLIFNVINVIVCVKNANDLCDVLMNHSVIFIYGIILRKPIIEISNEWKWNNEKMKMTEAKCNKKWENNGICVASND
jgi:hypothetical protein